MSFQLPLLSRVLASALATAGIMFAVAGCDVAPVGPTGTPPKPQQQQAAVAGPPQQIVRLGSPVILQVMRSQPAPASGKCPAGYVALTAPGSAGTCYRKLGTPVTVSSGSVSAVFAQGHPASYGFMVAPAGNDVPAVTTAIKQAYDVRGALAVTVAGRTWQAPQVLQPFSGQQLQIFFPSKAEALQLQRMLAPAS
jgi:hypothetical protein